MPGARMPAPVMAPVIAPVIALAFAAVIAVPDRAVAQDVPVSSLELQQARANGLKAKGARRAYTRTFDLSALPEYRPSRRLSGTIRQWGSNYLADSPLEGYLEDAFRRYHPDVRFDNNLSSTFVAMAGLYTGQADLAPMGRRATWDEFQAYQRTFGALPAEIVMATGSFNVSGWTYALVPFVNQANPITRLSLEQLDGIFGAQRDGGWDGNNWNPASARGPEGNLRTWGDLGLTGEWADKPIRVYAYNLNFHFPRDFAEKVFGGGYKWNETLREFSNRVHEPGHPDYGKLWSAGDQMMAAVAEDPYAITYTSMTYADFPGAKTVPLARDAKGPWVYPALETVQDRTYPLARGVYYYAKRPIGGRIDPLVAEFLRFVVSRQGQELVMKDGKYLPLTAEMARQQIVRIDAIGEAWEGTE